MQTVMKTDAQHQLSRLLVEDALVVGCYYSCQ